MPTGIYKRIKPPWNKEKKVGARSDETKKNISNSLKGEKAYNWKGDDAGYQSKHQWIKKHKGSPAICEHCGKTNKETKLTWANKNHKYKRVSKDWISLCYKCHYKFDNPNGRVFSRETRKKVSESVIRYYEKNSKKVLQLDLNGKIIKKYNGAGDASRKTGFFPNVIRKCCRNEIKTYKGFIWKYEAVKNTN